MIKVGIVGATGYAGAELVRILQGHPEAEIVWYGSKSYAGEAFASIYRKLPCHMYYTRLTLLLILSHLCTLGKFCFHTCCMGAR